MKMPDDLAATYQRQLLDQALQTNDDTPISQATVEAFLATPRHLFVRRYRERASTEWRDVDASNLTQHLATLYADNPLILFGDDDDNVPSTISQPSFVLRMLDLLQVRPGHAVLELGAGSGWNAALIGRLVGPSGRVVTLDLTGKPEGNYNVRLISRYRTAGGKVRRVVSTRNLSVACA